MGAKSALTRRDAAVIAGVGTAFFAFVIAGRFAIAQIPAFQEAVSSWAMSTPRAWPAVFLVSLVVVAGLVGLQKLRPRGSAAQAALIGSALALLAAVFTADLARIHYGYYAARTLILFAAMIGAAVVVHRVYSRTT